MYILSLLEKLYELAINMRKDNVILFDKFTPLFVALKLVWLNFKF